MWIIYEISLGTNHKYILELTYKEKILIDNPQEQQETIFFFLRQRICALYFICVNKYRIKKGKSDIDGLR